MEELKDELIIPPDKTSNYYIMKVKDYQKDLDTAIMKENNKVTEAAAFDLDGKAARFAADKNPF